ncbi:hypothetical protein PJ267_02130 [Arthrobacter sp. OVS8]|nr:hypothetical protein PJ267_02130 [Arthrobacter sp. OVS8]
MATTVANRALRRIIRTMSRQDNHLAARIPIRPEVTAQYRSSSTKMPRVPVVPAVVATRYFPANRCPIRIGSATNSWTPARVTAGSVATSSKWAISPFLFVTGSKVMSPMCSGSPLYSSR